MGSALFEAITALPEYGLTRADERLLHLHSRQIAAVAGDVGCIAELGSGSGRKTRWILEAFGRPVYHPIDVSPAALDLCRRQLSRFARVHTHAASYLDGLREVTDQRRNGRMLVLFLGSTIGNFDREEGRQFLQRVRAALQTGDLLLVGFDLIKSRETLLTAYDDPAGVTAAFNRNLLARINRELHADFNVRNFVHESRYDEGTRRVEMHLRSVVEQRVTLRPVRKTFHFAADETIWTESSHKYDRRKLAAIAANCGFREQEQWVDTEWPFAESFVGCGIAPRVLLVQARARRYYLFSAA